MRKLVVNSQQRRLRALWRLLLVSGMFYGLSFIVQMLVGIGIGVVAVLSGVKIADVAAVQAYILRNPMVRPLASLGSLLALWLSYLMAARWLDHRALPSFGLRFSRTWWHDFGFGLALGAGLVMLVFAVELAAGWIRVTGFLQSTIAGPSFWGGILGYVVTFFCVGIYEELFTRGYLLRNLAEGLSGRYLSPKAALLVAYALSSIAFGALHAANPNATLESTLSLMAAGLLLGLGYVLTGDLAISIGLHMTWNLFEGTVFGFPVSGGSTGASLISIVQRGPVAMTGGAFGPEAGLVGLAATVLGGVLILWWVRRTRGVAQLQESLALYTPPAAPAVAQEPASTQPST